MVKLHVCNHGPIRRQTTDNDNENVRIKTIFSCAFVSFY